MPKPFSKWPSAQLAYLLSGEQAWGDAPEAIRSWAMFYIHDAAKQVLTLPKEKRRAAMDKLPGTIRPKLEAEVKRLWALGLR